MFLLQFCLPEFEKMGLNFSEERCNPADILLDAVSASTWKVLQILRFVFVFFFDFAALLSFLAASTLVHSICSALASRCWLSQRR
jgi:hypothetical protein